jgi:tagaturonate reductase
VQSTGQSASVARMRALSQAQGFPVIVRGLIDGTPVERHETCRSVHEALDAREQWPAVRERVCGPVRVIVSNTGDTGWLLDAADGPRLLSTQAPAPGSFPARLLVLLHDRWQAQPDSELTLPPCELVSRNGESLREIVVALAREWSLGPTFLEWMSEQLNPFLAHRLADIAQNHAQKKVRRIEPCIARRASWLRGWRSRGCWPRLLPIECGCGGRPHPSEARACPSGRRRGPS